MGVPFGVTMEISSPEAFVKPPFYEDGLLFGCTHCGACCKQKESHVFLTATDFRRLAEHLELTDEEFFLEYCQPVDRCLATRVSLVAEEDGACIFLSEDGCDVYEARPRQCRHFPFWQQNLLDRTTFEGVAQHCPGLGQGTLCTGADIKARLLAEEQEPLLDLSESDPTSAE